VRNGVVGVIKIPLSDNFFIHCSQMLVRLTVVGGFLFYDAFSVTN